MKVIIVDGFKNVDEIKMKTGLKNKLQYFFGSTYIYFHKRNSILIILSITFEAIKKRTPLHDRHDSQVIPVLLSGFYLVCITRLKSNLCRKLTDGQFTDIILRLQLKLTVN